MSTFHASGSVNKRSTNKSMVSQAVIKEPVSIAKFSRKHTLDSTDGDGALIKYFFVKRVSAP